MKKELFLVFGYGVPGDIRQDLNYQVYIRVVFNTIYQAAESRNIAPHVVACGGPTDMVRPYRRTEAAEMLRVFKVMLKKLPARRQRGWSIQAQAKAISGLENLQFTRSVAQRIPRVTIFCETTRTSRVRQLARLVYGRGVNTKVVGVDFDATSNRFHDPAYLREKERSMLAFDLWALKSPARMRRHHNLHQERLDSLRKAGSKHHIQEIKKWWDETLKEFPKISSKIKSPPLA